MTAAEIYRYLYRKYIRIKRTFLRRCRVLQLIHEGWHPVLAVHVRREEDDMIIDERKEIVDEIYWRRYSMKYGSKDPRIRKRKRYFPKMGKLLKANTQYHPEIRKMIDKYSIRKIFLLTDSEEVVEEYRKCTAAWVYTDKQAIVRQRTGFQTGEPHVKRRRGIEAIKDACLATQ